MSKEWSENFPSSKAKGFGQESISKRLHKSLATVASLIDKGNEDLWPIFERLECELKRIDERVFKLSQYVNN